MLAASKEWIASIDDDVHLKDVWIEEIWSYIKHKNMAVGGRVAFNKRHSKWFVSKKGVETQTSRGRVQNTLLRKDWISGINAVEVWGIDENIYITELLTKKGIEWYTVPVNSIHSNGCFPNAIGEGTRCGARWRRMGYYKTWPQILKHSIRAILGGIKISFMTRENFYIQAAIKRAIGYIRGFVRWNKY